MSMSTGGKVVSLVTTDGDLTLSRQGVEEIAIDATSIHLKKASTVVGSATEAYTMSRPVGTGAATGTNVIGQTGHVDSNGGDVAVSAGAAGAASGAGGGMGGDLHLSAGAGGAGTDALPEGVGGDVHINAGDGSSFGVIKIGEASGSIQMSNAGGSSTVQGSLTVAEAATMLSNLEVGGAEVAGTHAVSVASSDDSTSVSVSTTGAADKSASFRMTTNDDKTVELVTTAGDLTLRRQGAEEIVIDEEAIHLKNDDVTLGSNFAFTMSRPVHSTGFAADTAMIGQAAPDTFLGGSMEVVGGAGGAAELDGGFGATGGEVSLMGGDGGSAAADGDRGTLGGMGGDAHVDAGRAGKSLVEAGVASIASPINGGKFRGLTSIAITVAGEGYSAGAPPSISFETEHGGVQCEGETAIASPVITDVTTTVETVDAEGNPVLDAEGNPVTEDVVTPGVLTSIVVTQKGSGCQDAVAVVSCTDGCQVPTTPAQIAAVPGDAPHGQFSTSECKDNPLGEISMSTAGSISEVTLTYNGWQCTSKPSFVITCDGSCANGMTQSATMGVITLQAQPEDGIVYVGTRVASQVHVGIADNVANDVSANSIRMHGLTSFSSDATFDGNVRIKNSLARTLTVQSDNNAAAAEVKAGEGSTATVSLMTGTNEFKVDNDCTGDTCTVNMKRDSSTAVSIDTDSVNLHFDSVEVGSDAHFAMNRPQRNNGEGRRFDVNGQAGDVNYAGGDVRLFAGAGGARNTNDNTVGSQGGSLSLMAGTGGVCTSGVCTAGNGGDLIMDAGAAGAGTGENAATVGSGTIKIGETSGNVQISKEGSATTVAGTLQVGADGTAQALAVRGDVTVGGDQSASGARSLTVQSSDTSGSMSIKSAASASSSLFMQSGIAETGELTIQTKSATSAGMSFGMLKTTTGGGSGYTSTPTVVLTDTEGNTVLPGIQSVTIGDQGAYMGIATISISNPGTYGDNTPEIVFGGSSGCGVLPTAALTMDAGSISSVTITDRGKGCNPSNPPTVAVQCSGCEDSTPNDGEVTVTVGTSPSVEVDNGNSCSQKPTATLSFDDKGAVTGVNLVSQGVGCPGGVTSVLVCDANCQAGRSTTATIATTTVGSQMSAVAYMGASGTNSAGKVVSVAVKEQGTGYSGYVPVVSFTGGHDGCEEDCSTATAVASRDDSDLLSIQLTQAVTDFVKLDSDLTLDAGDTSDLYLYPRGSTTTGSVVVGSGKLVVHDAAGNDAITIDGRNSKMYGGANSDFTIESLGLSLNSALIKANSARSGTGTISTQDEGTTMVGQDTTFLTELSVGDTVRVEQTQTPNGVLKRITSSGTTVTGVGGTSFMSIIRPRDIIIARVQGAGTVAGTLDSDAGTTTITGTNTVFKTNFKVGDTLYMGCDVVGGGDCTSELNVLSIDNDNQMTTEMASGAINALTNYFIGEQRTVEVVPSDSSLKINNAFSRDIDFADGRAYGIYLTAQMLSISSDTNAALNRKLEANTKPYQYIKPMIKLSSTVDSAFDSSGRLGLGTRTPGAMLDVQQYTASMSVSSVGTDQGAKLGLAVGRKEGSGTVSSGGSPTVLAGDGSAFTTELGVGMTIYTGCESITGCTSYATISRINSDTEVELFSPGLDLDASTEYYISKPWTMNAYSWGDWSLLEDYGRKVGTGSMTVDGTAVTGVATRFKAYCDTLYVYHTTEELCDAGVAGCQVTVDTTVYTATAHALYSQTGCAANEAGGDATDQGVCRTRVYNDVTATEVSINYVENAELQNCAVGATTAGDLTTTISHHVYTPGTAGTWIPNEVAVGNVLYADCSKDGCLQFADVVSIESKTELTLRSPGFTAVAGSSVIYDNNARLTVTAGGKTTVHQGGLNVGAGGATIYGNTQINGNFAVSGNLAFAKDGDNVLSVETIGPSQKAVVALQSNDGDTNPLQWAFSVLPDGNMYLTEGLDASQEDQRVWTIASGGRTTVHSGGMAVGAGGATIAGGLTVSDSGATVSGNSILNVGDAETVKVKNGDHEVMSVGLTKAAAAVSAQLTMTGLNADGATAYPWTKTVGNTGAWTLAEGDDVRLTVAVGGQTTIGAGGLVANGGATVTDGGVTVTGTNTDSSLKAVKATGAGDNDAQVVLAVENAATALATITTTDGANKKTQYQMKGVTGDATNFDYTVQADATSWALLQGADSKLSVAAGSGAATIASGLTVTAGGMTVSDGGAAITGDSSINGATTITGATGIVGATTVTGDVLVKQDASSVQQTIQGGGADATAELKMTATDAGSAAQTWSFKSINDGSFSLGKYDGDTLNAQVSVAAAGATTIASGLTVTAGGLTVSDGGAQITGETRFTATDSDDNNEHQFVGDMLVSKGTTAGSCTSTVQSYGAGASSNYAELRLARQEDAANTYWAMQHNSGASWTLTESAAPVSPRITVATGGQTTIATGLTVTAGGLTVTAGGLTVSSATGGNSLDGDTVVQKNVGGSDPNMAFKVRGVGSSAGAEIHIVANGDSVSDSPQSAWKFVSEANGKLNIKQAEAGVLGGNDQQRLSIDNDGKVTMESGGVEVKAGGLTVTDGGMTVSAGGSVVNGDSSIVGDSGDADEILTLSKGNTAKMMLKVLSSVDSPVNNKAAEFVMTARGMNTDVTYTMAADKDNLVFYAGTSAGTAKLTIAGGVSTPAVTVNTGGFRVASGGIVVGDGGLTVESGGATVTGGLAVENNGATIKNGLEVVSDDLTVTGGSFIVASGGSGPNQGSTCTAGKVTWDADFVFVCTATNTWKRAALADY
jgi:hypothetical protein